jgi:hypothetical protein
MRTAGKLRVEYPGEIYYIMNRGHRRELIFKDDVDRMRIPMKSAPDPKI